MLLKNILIFLFILSFQTAFAQDDTTNESPDLNAKSRVAQCETAKQAAIDSYKILNSESVDCYSKIPGQAANTVHFDQRPENVSLADLSVASGTFSGMCDHKYKDRTAQILSTFEAQAGLPTKAEAGVKDPREVDCESVYADYKPSVDMKGRWVGGHKVIDDLDGCRTFSDTSTCGCGDGPPCPPDSAFKRMQSASAPPAPVPDQPLTPPTPDQPPAIAAAPPLDPCKIFPDAGIQCQPDKFAQAESPEASAANVALPPPPPPAAPPPVSPAAAD